MKIILSKELQNKALLVNGEVFKELTNLMNLDTASMDETTKKSVEAHIKEITEKNVVAISFEPTATEDKKKRTQADKVGKFRYLNRKVDRLREETRDVKQMLKMVTLSLAPFLDVKGDTLQRIVCEDEVDDALFDHLVAKGNEGTTPSIAIDSDELMDYKLKPYQITRRIQRMNRRLKDALQRDFAVSIDRRWKLSLFSRKTMDGDSS